MSIDKLFELSNLFVLPFWALMIFLPKWKIAQQIVASYLPYIALAGLYIYFLVGAITPESAQAMSNPDLSQIASFFADPHAAATGWTHFLVMDLFVGRWIFLEGQRTGVWTAHSIAFCLFAGPIGLLSHILTATISEKFFAPKNQPEATEAGGTV